jgi:hypothetical protein
VSETYPRFEREALESDLAARRGERQLPRQPRQLEPMDPGDVAEPVVTAELHLDRISDKIARDILRQAAREAKHGPVCDRSHGVLSTRDIPR